MKITCIADNLRKAISISERMVGKKESLPVLACFLLSAEKGVCTIRATNLEAGIEVQFPVDCTEEGTIAVPAQILSNTIKVTSGEKITISTHENGLSIISKSGTTSIKSIAHEEFPKIPFTGESGMDTVQKSVMIEGIQSVAYAASLSMVRPELSSVYMSQQEGSLVFVATDSFRLAEKKFSVPMKESNTDLLVPNKNAQELLHVLQLISDERISFMSDETQLYVKGAIGNATVRFVSRVVDGSFPNYKEIIPKSFITEVTVLKDDFQSVLRKARLFANTSQQVQFHIYPSKKIFSITAQNQDVGEMDEKLDAAVTGDDIDINFNIGYMSDCFQSIASDSVVCSFAGIGKPLILQGVGDHSFRYLVMPLNR